jgi:5-methylcytosine-specific restriction endonuclease McrA
MLGTESRNRPWGLDTPESGPYDAAMESGNAAKRAAGVEQSPSQVPALPPPYSKKRETYRRWRERNVEHLRLSKRQYREMNREAIREAARLYRQQNVEKERDRKRRYEQSNPDKVLAKNRRWRETHPEARLQQRQRHRARKRENVADLTDVQWLAVQIELGERCVYCGGEPQSLDHETPVSKGGGHTRSNVVPACFSCNASKRDRGGAEFVVRILPRLMEGRHGA